MPIGIAPTAMQRMAHPEGELANVRGNHALSDKQYIDITITQAFPPHIPHFLCRSD